MGLILFILCFVAVVWVGVVTGNSFFAYFEGKSDARRVSYYSTYENTYWMPVAYFYNLGYLKAENEPPRVPIKDKNNYRFGREE